VREGVQFLAVMLYGRHARVLLSNGAYPLYGRGVPGPVPSVLSGPVVVPAVVNPGRSAHARSEES